MERTRFSGQLLPPTMFPNLLLRINSGKHESLISFFLSPFERKENTKEVKAKMHIKLCVFFVMFLNSLLCINANECEYFVSFPHHLV